MPLLLRAYLALSALVLLLVGGVLLFAPVSFWAASGVDLDPARVGMTDLLSDIQSAAALILAAGLFTAAGAANVHLARPAAWVAVTVFGSYAIGRVAGIALHGMPGSPVLAALGIEAALAALGLLALRRADGPSRAPAGALRA